MKHVKNGIVDRYTRISSSGQAEGIGIMNSSERHITSTNPVPQGTVTVAEILNYLAGDRYMSLSETIAYLNLSERTIREYLPEIPHFRIRTKLLFQKSELDTWILRYREQGDELDLGKIADEALDGILKLAK